MSLSAFFLVLAAAVCHATWNLCVKRINGGAELVWLFSIISCVLYLPATISIIVTVQPHFGWLEFGFVVGSSLLHLGYFLLLQAGYRKGDLSLVYPTARATGPLLSVSFAVLFLGEYITLQIAAGAALIIFGVISLTGGFGKRSSNLSSSLAFGIGSGTFIGAYTVWDAHAVAILLVPPLVLDLASILCRMTILTPVAIKRFDLVKSHWNNYRWEVMIIAIFSPLAYILVLYALTFTPVVYIAPLRESSVLITVLLGSMILGEGDLKRRLGWAVVILAGVSILATG